MIMTILELIFWLMVLLLGWTYFGYPLALQLLALFLPKKVARKNYQNQISVVITAYNEERNIKKKIKNTLSQTYPADMLEIIVVSDASTDSTDEIVRSFVSQGVRLLRIDERHGKHYGQGRGIRMANADVVVLSDATTFLAVDAVEKIAMNFSDPTVGCVSGQDKILNAEPDVAPGEEMYVSYEMTLRGLESSVGSLVGVSGCFFAVRKHLCENWVDNMSSDFYLPIISHMNGFRTIIDMEAIGYYEILERPGKEFVRKVRTVVHGMEVLSLFRGILNPFRYGSYSLQIFSHKLSRWLVPIYLIILLLVNLVLAQHTLFFLVTFLAQVVLYLLALIAALAVSLKKYQLFRTVFFFVMVNYAILVAWYAFLMHKEFVLWEPTKR